MSSQKKKGSAGHECANCGTSESDGVTLNSCGRCRDVKYCSRDCQRQHWSGGHRQFCVSPQNRRPAHVQAAAAAAAAAAEREAASPTGDISGEDAEECAICLAALEKKPALTSMTLPCSHIFHTSCVSELRKFGVSQACPLCRSELPPEEENFDIALRRYQVIKRKVTTCPAHLYIFGSSLSSSLCSKRTNICLVLPRNLFSSCVSSTGRTRSVYLESVIQC